MKLPRFLRRLMKKPSPTVERRNANISKIENLGFKVEDISGWHEKKFSHRRYRIIGPDGNVLDNEGEGFATSAEAYRAARSASKKLE